MKHRTLSEILQESRRTYNFKLGFAGDLPEGFENRLETNLKRYGLLKMSPAKTTPIQERPLDFPQMQNCNVTYYEVELEYPTTQQVLGEYLGKSCGVDRCCVVVRRPGEPIDAYQETTEDGAYEPLLTTKDMAGESAQGDVGENRVMELLKELEKARQERGDSASDYAPQGTSSDIGSQENVKSIQGS